MREMMTGGEFDRLIAAAAEDASGSLTLLGLSLGVGGATPYPVAPVGIEVVRVASGSIGVTVAGRRSEARAGDTLVLDRPYRLENVGDGEASLVIVAVAAATPAASFRAAA